MKIEKIAYEKGYRFKNGHILSPSKKILKIFKNNREYSSFNISIGSRKDNTRKIKKVLLHRFIMYQRHKDLLFNFECVRHKDGNKENNSYSNLRFGSYKSNQRDIPIEKRIKRSIYASSHARLFSNEEIKEIKSKHSGYKKTMEKYGIKSKGTLWHILNNNYVTEKAS